MASSQLLGTVFEREYPCAPLRLMKLLQRGPVDPSPSSSRQRQSVSFYLRRRVGESLAACDIYTSALFGIGKVPHSHFNERHGCEAA